MKEQVSQWMDFINNSASFTDLFISAIRRRLFTRESLDILSYENDRAKALKNIENPDDFKSNLKCYLKDEPEKSLDSLMKSLDILVHIISPTKADYDLLEQTLIQLTEFPKYANNVKGVFGNHVMKALYSLNALVIIKKVCYVQFYSIWK